MANGLYAAAKGSLLTAGLDLSAATIRALPVDAGQYTVNLATHATLTDVPSGARSAAGVALASKTTTGGVFDAADLTFPAVANGKVCSAYILYNHTGTDGTSKLIAYIDTATGLPLTATGADVVSVWDNGASKIFAL